MEKCERALYSVEAHFINTEKTESTMQKLFENLLRVSMTKINQVLQMALLFHLVGFIYSPAFDISFHRTYISGPYLWRLSSSTEIWGDQSICESVLEVFPNQNWLISYIP